MRCRTTKDKIHYLCSHNAFGGLLIDMDRERFTFKKQERLSGEKRVDSLFEKGHSFIAYPLRVVYAVTDITRSCPAAILVSVPKKKMKRAVQRNRIKRLVRESYRLNKSTLLSKLNNKGVAIDIAFIYLKEELSDFKLIQKAMQKALLQIGENLKPDDENA